jgi:hypothetical protein
MGLGTGGRPPTDNMDAEVVLEWDWVLFDMVDQETLDMVVFDTW